MIYFVAVAVLVAATALLLRLLFLEKDNAPAAEVLPEGYRQNQSLIPTSKTMLDTIPHEWNDQLITQQILALQERPPVLAHFINSVMGRFIIGQNEKTAQKRTELILTVTKQLQATKELRIALDDLQIHNLEREIRFKKTELEHVSILDRLAKQQELEDLQRQKERLELEVQIAKLEEEKRSYQKPDTDEKRKPTRDELREAKKVEIKRTETEMAEAILEITKGVPLDQLAENDQDRVMRTENFYNDKRIRLEEELARL